jgi:hypothetical protein
MPDLASRSASLDSAPLLLMAIWGSTILAIDYWASSDHLNVAMCKVALQGAGVMAGVNARRLPPRSRPVDEQV